MKSIFKIVLVFSVVLLSGCSSKVEEKPTVEINSGVIAPNIVVGKPIKSVTLKDQFDKTGTIKPDTKKIIFVFAKSTGHLVKEYLNTKPNDYLTKKHTVFIADVSGMPSMILKYMALPDLKKHKYSIYLIRDEKISEGFKNSKYKDYIMVVTLSNGTVKGARFVTTAKELQSAIE